MPPVTFPNQRLIKIHREPAKSNFLGIQNENWMSASRDLGAHALQLYLYFAANANNYTLALSPTAIRQSIGMARSTYHDQFQKLVEKGYLIHTKGNTFEFYETPQPGLAQTSQNSMSDSELNFEECTPDSSGNPQTDNSVLAEGIEINNTKMPDNTMINNEMDSVPEGIYIPKVKEITIPRPQVKPKKEAFVF